ncbi:MAG TPA: hypothetical protein VN868_06365 [Terriglobales bacterium]|nr:hypothetical protein [Terriglobales bacterium]
MGSASLAAVTVAAVAAGTAGAAVNKPEELMVPAVADQETAWFDESRIVAVNCCVEFPMRAG